MHPIFAFALGSLATFRIALLISEEEGPAGMFRRLRKLPPSHSNARRGLSCPWCVGVYSSALVCTGLWLLDVFPGEQWALWWLAVAGGAVGLNQMWTKN